MENLPLLLRDLRKHDTGNKISGQSTAKNATFVKSLMKRK
jgi:hypothetical protein